jgi:hypothetical protein
VGSVWRNIVGEPSKEAHCSSIGTVLGRLRDFWENADQQARLKGCSSAFLRPVITADVFLGFLAVSR